MALVSGGVVAYGLVVVATFALNRRAFGPIGGGLGIGPAGVRLDRDDLALGPGDRRPPPGGGLARRGVRAALGRADGADGGDRPRWGSGAGSAFISTRCSPSPGSAWAWRPASSPSDRPPSPSGTGKPSRSNSSACLLAFALASGVGVAPRMIGQRVDPHDAYVGQFEPVISDRSPGAQRPDLAAGLPAEAGRRPSPARAPGRARARRSSTEVYPSTSPAKGVPWLGAGGHGRLARPVRLGDGEPWQPAGRRPTRPDLAIRLGLLASSLAVLAGFLVYPSISNSDHYRYLVFLAGPLVVGLRPDDGPARVEGPRRDSGRPACWRWGSPR